MCIRDRPDPGPNKELTQTTPPKNLQALHKCNAQRRAVSYTHLKHFLGYTGVLATAMYFVISMSIVVGFLGYVKYGDDVQGSITLNLPNDV